MKNVLCLAVGKTYDIVIETGITAHPAVSPYPKTNADFVIPIEVGGRLEYFYAVKQIIECLPEDISEYKDELTVKDYAALQKYHELRQETFGFNKADTKYRFYILDLLSGISQPFYKKGIQIAAYMDSCDIPTIKLSNRIISNHQIVKQYTEQEKRDAAYPRKYVTELDVTKEDWISLLQNPEVFKKNDIKLVKRLYMHDNHAAAASVLSSPENKKPMAYNSQVKNLGIRISNALKLGPIIGDDGKQVWWRVPFWGTYLDNGTFEWKLRPELAEAIGLLYPEVEHALDIIADENEENRLNFDIKNADLKSLIVQEHTIRPKEKNQPIYTGGRKVYTRDRQTSLNALAYAKYKCEIDPKHPTFIRRNSDRQYTEPHHLIPMAASELFNVSLDTEANIVSLCSNCHNQIHYGKDAAELIFKLYKDRKELLLKAGIDIELAELLQFYDLEVPRIKFAELKNEISCLNEVELKRSPKSSSGRNNLQDLKWLRYSLSISDNNWNMFDHVLFMPYKIDQEIWEEAKKTIITNDISVDGIERPHIDFETGNIHPSKLNIILMKETVKQLILVKHQGPILKKKPKGVSCYEYTVDGNTKYVPKACYYPPICDSDIMEVEDTYAYKMLKALWDDLSIEKI